MKKILLIRSGLITMLTALVVFGGNMALAKPFAYVTNQNSNSVSVIDTKSNAVVTTISVGDSPYGLALTPDGSRVYVLNVSSNNVSVIDTTSNTVVATIWMGINSAWGIAFTPDGSRAYVTHHGTHNVSVIDTKLNTVITAIAVGTHPTDVEITADGSRAYVVNHYGNSVSEINTTSNTVSDTISVGNRPISITLTPDGSNAYVTNSSSNTVSVFNTTSNTVSDTISVGNRPYEVAFTPDGSYAYVTNQNSNSVSVIDIEEDNNVTTTIAVGSQPYEVSVTPDGSRAYVTNSLSNNVSVIDTKSYAVTTISEVENFPLAVTIMPNTKPVAHAGGNKSVVVWDTVELNGTSSTDADGDSLTFNWSLVSKPEGSIATLSGATSPTASLEVDVNGTYDVNLTVNDGLIDSDPDSASIIALTVLNAMTLVLDEAMDAINNIPPADFKNPKQANALTKKINVVFKMIEKEQYQKALDKLTDDILIKTDGCENGGKPDKDDWIRNCVKQDAVYSLLVEAISIVNSQL